MGMTTDKALEILGMSEQARWRSGYEPTDEKEAIETIREALEQSNRYKQALEDIKQKLDKELEYQWRRNQYGDGYKAGILHALKLIANVCVSGERMTLEEVQKQIGYSDVYTLEEFRSYVKRNSFNSYDGCGYLHDGAQETEISVWSINIFNEQWNKYPYVCWYNK